MFFPHCPCVCTASLNLVVERAGDKRRKSPLCLFALGEAGLGLGIAVYVTNSVGQFTLVPLMRWTLVALLAAAVLLLASLVVGNAGGIEDWLTGSWPRWLTFAILGGLAIFTFAYVREQTRWRLLRLGSTVFISMLMPILAAPLLWLSSLVTVGLTPLFVRLGRVRDR